MESQFRLTGKHVLAALAGFFLLILTANMIFLNFAIKTFPGEKVEKSYLQGLNYNDQLDARDGQAALGWRVTVEEASFDGDKVKLTLAIADQDDAPLSQLAIAGVLSRPAHSANDNEFVFIATGEGRYQAFVAAGDGVWDLDAKAVNANSEELAFHSRIILQ